jgi:hypothetical protein
LEILLDPKSSFGAVHLLHLFVVAAAFALLLLLLPSFCLASPCWQFMLNSTLAF